MDDVITSTIVDILYTAPEPALPLSVLRERLAAELGARAPAYDALRARLDAAERFLVLEPSPLLARSGCGGWGAAYEEALRAAGLAPEPRVVLREPPADQEPPTDEPWPVRLLRSTLLALAERASHHDLADAFDQLARLRALTG